MQCCIVGTLAQGSEVVTPAGELVGKLERDGERLYLRLDPEQGRVWRGLPLDVRLHLKAIVPGA